MGLSGTGTGIFVENRPIFQPGEAGPPRRLAVIARTECPARRGAVT